jgi:hypothetical protein
MFVAAGLTLLVGCSTSGKDGDLLENQPPHVWLASAPPEGTTSLYSIHLYWGGWDPDGRIAYYEYAITDNEGRMVSPDVPDDMWRKVYGNDSTFVFSADQLADSSATEAAAEYQRAHSFFVRAVDEQGLASREPAYRSFTARTLAPEIDIEVPTQHFFFASEVPPITTFRWNATDYVGDRFVTQDPESVQWALVSTRDFDSSYPNTIAYLRKDPDILAQYGRTPEEADAECEPWIYYRQPGDSGHFWTSSPIDFGQYIYAMRAKDEAGAVTAVLAEAHNVRRLKVKQRDAGPNVTLTNEYMGGLTLATCNPVPAILDVPEGVPLKFSWTAEADHYGGLVAGYRYGWDIADLTDPEQWEIDITPFSSIGIYQASAPSNTFYFGSHRFTLEVVDNSGYCTRVEVKVNVVPFTMGRDLLLVDDYSVDENTYDAGWGNFRGRGVQPNDEEHDDFWLYVLQDVQTFNPATDVIELTGTSVVPLTLLANYKSIVWSVYGNRAHQAGFPLLYQFIAFRPKEGGGGTGKRIPNVIALFMAAGGHVLLSGNHPVSNVINRAEAGGLRFPVIFLYEMTARQDLGEEPNVNDADDRIGEFSFAYRELCLETMDFARTSRNVRRDIEQYCAVNGDDGRTISDLRIHTLREARPLDLAFPLLQLRPQAAGSGKAYQESEKGLDVEVYNPDYFFTLCDNYTAFRNDPALGHPCFHPIYGLHCLDDTEPTYDQPVAFWTSTYAHVQANPSTVRARSAVFGFPPVFFEPDAAKVAIERIVIDEWQLPRRP